MTSYEVVIKKSVAKFLDKLEKSTPREYSKIIVFLNEKLSKSDNPCKLSNAKHIKGFDDNHYRWRVGEYRIIGIVKNGKFKIIEIIKIDKRGDTTYKGL